MALQCGQRDEVQCFARGPEPNPQDSCSNIRTSLHSCELSASPGAATAQRGESMACARGGGVALGVASRPQALSPSLPSVS